MSASTHQHQPLPIRLGVSSRLLGQPWLRDHPPPAAHLSLGLLWLQAVVHYLVERRIWLYRIPDRIAACLLNHEPAQLNAELRECSALLDDIRALVARYNLRFSMHLPIELAPGSAGERYTGRIQTAIAVRMHFLEALCGDQGVLVSHIGGTAGDAGVPLRFARQVGRLTETTTAHLAVEPADHGQNLVMALAVHEYAGTPVVFDTLHHQANNPARQPLGDALAMALGTWPAGVRPKVHVASQRTEAHLIGSGRAEAGRIIAPRIGQHADFINVFEFAGFLETAAGSRPFDALLEAKAGDLALLRLRADLAQFSPELASRLGVDEC